MRKNKKTMVDYAIELGLCSDKCLEFQGMSVDEFERAEIANPSLYMRFRAADAIRGQKIFSMKEVYVSCNQMMQRALPLIEGDVNCAEELAFLSETLKEDEPDFSGFRPRALRLYRKYRSEIVNKKPEHVRLAFLSIICLFNAIAHPFKREHNIQDCVANLEKAIVASPVGPETEKLAMIEVYRDMEVNEVKKTEMKADHL